MNAAALTMSQKIGQLLMVGFDGLEPDQHIESLLQREQIGGVILFRRNVANPQQLSALTQALQTRNALASPLPLLMAIDQEGGMVARLEEGLTPLPSAQAFAHAGSACDCQTLTRIANTELRELGINVNFAPVLDVNNNPRNPVIGVRAYGSTVETVCEYGLAAMAGVEAAGIAPVIKHFPGHGDTEVDSHLGLPVVLHERKRLDEIELAPFRAALAAGAPAVMSAHIVFPAIEPDRDTPSTCSHAVLTGLLRREMGFEGVIFTDCLEMDAIAAGMGVVAGALAAFRAGADVLLVSHRLDRQRAVHAALLQAVLTGEISEERVEQSLARILALKARYRMTDWPRMRQSLADPLAALAGQALSARIHAGALTWAGAPQRLRRDVPTLVVQCEVRSRTEMDEVESRSDTLAALLSEAGLPVRAVFLPLAPGKGEAQEILRLLADFGQIVFVSYNAILQPAQAALLTAMAEQCAERLWLVAGRIIGDLAHWPMLRGRLGCYANRPAAMRVVCDALLCD